MLYLNETAILTDETIRSLTEGTVEAYKQAAGKRATALVKLTLAVEEILLDFRDAYGCDTPCTVLVSKFLGKIIINFRQKGIQTNAVASDDADSLSHNILVRLEILPKYNYNNRSGMNSVSLVAEQKPLKNKSARDILTALILAGICYFLMGLLPAAVQSAIAQDIISPVFDKLTFVITAVATPLVFFAVVNGIAEIGDVQALGFIGKRYLYEVMLTYLLAGFSFTVLAAIVYGVDFTGSGAGGGFLKQTVQLVLDIVPNNLLQPFTIDNDLQVVVVAVLVGTSLLGLQKKAEPIKEALSLISDLINQMMIIVFKLVPAIVFFGVLNILCRDMAGLGKLYIVFLLFVVSSAIVVVYVTVRTCVTMKVPFSVFFKKQLATTMINLTTSSQVSALPENIICCKEKFGINEKMIDFALPLGIVIFMPCGAIFIGLLAASLAAVSGVTLTLATMIKLVFVSIILAIAAPPIPGSALAIMPIVFASCGIPDSVFPIAVVIGTILGYILPAFNGFLLQLQLLLVAVKTNKVDMEKLRTPVSEG